MTFLEFFEALIGCAKIFTESSNQNSAGETTQLENETIGNDEEDKVSY